MLSTLPHLPVMPLLPPEPTTRRVPICDKTPAPPDDDRATSTEPDSGYSSLTPAAKTLKRPLHIDEDEELCLVPAQRTKCDTADSNVMEEIPFQSNSDSFFSADRFQHDSEDEEDLYDGYVNEEGEEVDLLQSDGEEEGDLPAALSSYQPPTPRPWLDLMYHSKNSGSFEIVPPPLVNPRSQYHKPPRNKRLESHVLKDFKVIIL